jgi:hypothetical protein
MAFHFRLGTSVRLAFVQKLFDVHLDLAIWTFRNIFFWDVDYLGSFTFGAFDLDGFPFVSHGRFLLLRTYYHNHKCRTREKSPLNPIFTSMLEGFFIYLTWRRSRTRSPEMPRTAMDLFFDVAPDFIDSWP